LTVFDLNRAVESDITENLDPAERVRKDHSLGRFVATAL